MNRLKLLPLLLLGLATACSEQPLDPSLSPDQSSAAIAPLQMAKGGGNAKAIERAGILTEIPVATDDFEGWISITELSLDESAGERQLLADVVVTWIDDSGVYTGELLDDQPIDISRSPASTASSITTPGLSLERSPSETGACDILYLTLGPLDLDLLGLTLDLAVVELDLDAVAGSGNLLGNLLCAVTGLLDGGPLAGLLSLIGSINDLLDGVTSILDGIAVIGNVIDDLLPASTLALSGATASNGSFVGSLSVTSLDYDPETGSLLVDGVLSGKIRDGKKTTRVTNMTITDVPATLTSGGTASPMAAALLGPDEPGVCDILYLDLAPTYLDLLGLTVDLAEVELDLDAVPGGGNLLGNLLCAVTGLLDGAAGGGLGGLLEGLLQGVLDLVNQLLGGLTL